MDRRSSTGGPTLANKRGPPAQSRAAGSRRSASCWWGRTRRGKGDRVDWNIVGALGEVAGANAVVCTLEYLARQIRKDARQDRRAQYTQLDRDLLQLPASCRTAPSFAGVFFRGAGDPSSLQSPELARFNSGMLIIFRALEALFQYHRQGGLDDWGAESTRAAMIDVVGMPCFREFWAHRRKWISSEFQDEVAEWLPRATDSILVTYYGRERSEEQGSEAQ